MKRALCLVALAVSAACWRSSSPPPAKPDEPPPAPVVARPARAAPPMSDVDRLFQAFEGFADDMCNCTDMTCAQRVSDDMTKWSQEVAKSSGETRKFTDEENQRAGAIGERLGKCMQNAMSGGTGSATTP